MDGDGREPLDPADVRAAAEELVGHADDLAFDREAGPIARGEYDAGVADLAEAAEPEVVVEARRRQAATDPAGATRTGDAARPGVGMGRQADRDAPCAAWLRRRLAAEGLLAVDLAAALGVSPRTVYAWRRGYRIPAPALRPRLATLLESVGDPPPPLPIGTRRVGPSPASPFARRLGAELGRRGWSPAAFARAAGVHQSLGSRWCRGESAPDRASRAKIAAALGVEPAELERWAEGER